MHFYVDLSICLWIYMYISVDCTAFVCASLHICAQIHETPLLWLIRKCGFLTWTYLKPIRCHPASVA